MNFSQDVKISVGDFNPYSTDRGWLQPKKNQARFNFKGFKQMRLKPEEKFWVEAHFGLEPKRPRRVSISARLQTGLVKTFKFCLFNLKVVLLKYYSNNVYTTLLYMDQ